MAEINLVDRKRRHYSGRLCTATVKYCPCRALNAFSLDRASLLRNCRDHARTVYLLVIILLSVVDDVEEAELVDTLAGRDDTEPVTELLLLKVLLCPVCSRQSQSIS